LKATVIGADIKPDVSAVVNDANMTIGIFLFVGMTTQLKVSQQLINK
jgi:hypothetical protein